MTAAEPVLRWLVDGSLAATAAVLLVLALRHPLRHAFGARVAYGAWALVPLALLAAALPRPRVDQVLAPQFLALHPGMFVVAGQGAANEGLAAGGVDWPLVLFAAWLLGAALAAVRFTRQQRRF